MNAFEKARITEQVMPVPTSESITDLATWLGGGLKHEDLPRGMRPQMLYDTGILTEPTRDTAFRPTRSGSFRLRRP